MTNPNESRLEALKAEVAKHATPAAFARAYGLDVTYIRQLLGGHRNFGERAARTMSQAMFGHPDHFSVAGAEAPHSLDSRCQAICTALHHLPEDRAKLWTAMIIAEAGNAQLEAVRAELGIQQTSHGPIHPKPKKSA